MSARTTEFTNAEFAKHCVDSVRTSMEPLLTDLRRRCADAARAATSKGPDAVREAVNAVALEVEP